MVATEEGLRCAYCAVQDLFFARERNNATVEDIFGATLFPSTHDYLTDLRCYCTELFGYFLCFFADNLIHVKVNRLILNPEFIVRFLTINHIFRRVNLVGVSQSGSFPTRRIMTSSHHASFSSTKITLLNISCQKPLWLHVTRQHLRPRCLSPLICHLSAQHHSDKLKCVSFVQLICGIFVNAGRNADGNLGDEAFILE